MEKTCIDVSTSKPSIFFTVVSNTFLFPDKEKLRTHEHEGISIPRHLGPSEIVEFVPYILSSTVGTDLGNFGAKVAVFCHDILFTFHPNFCPQLPTSINNITTITSQLPLIIISKPTRTSPFIALRGRWGWLLQSLFSNVRRWNSFIYALWLGETCLVPSLPIFAAS